jgi:tetratricopeptide (TPR) repeat protein
VFDVRRGSVRRTLAIAIGILTIVLVALSLAWYRAEQGHRLIHAAMTGRDEPIRAALSRDPGDATLWELLGEAYANQSRYQEAVQAYDRSIALAPGDETTWWMKGIAEVCRGNRAGIEVVEARLRALSPDSAAQFHQIAPNGCSAFGSGVRQKSATSNKGLKLTIGGMARTEPPLAA